MNNTIKKISIIFLAGLAILYILFRCVLLNTQFVCRETYLKYKLAPKKFPTLNYVTVNELKDIVDNDTHSAKILCFCDCLAKCGTGYIRNSVIPKWLDSDTTSSSLYIIVSDCATLSDTDVFNSFDIPSAHILVIRDNSKQFRSYGSILPEIPRTHKIVGYIAPSENLNLITVREFQPHHSLLLDSLNNIKICKIFGSSQNGSDCQIIPMPYEIISDLDSVNFNIIDSIDINDYHDIPLFLYLNN